MAVSLQYQTVYCHRDRVLKPATMTMVAVAVLLLILTFKIWIKAGIVDVGYELAEVKKHNNYLVMKRSELELQQSILLRPDHIKKSARNLGLTPVVSEQILTKQSVNATSRKK